MSTTEDRITTARDALTAAEAEVDRLRARLRGELEAQEARGVSAEDRPHRLGWVDGVAEARRRHGDRVATADDPGDAEQTTDAPRLATAANGRAEAQRRIAARRDGHAA